MSRIRTVKPEFFKHEALFDAEQESGLPLRLAFAGLWTCCDREGRFVWRPRALKSDILPHDSIDFGAVLESLLRFGFVTKYEVDGKEYGCVPSFSRHQTINQREAASRIPGPDDPGQMEMHVQARALTAGEYEYRGINIAPALRDTIFARDGSKCLRCGTTDDLTVDHIFPRAIGGNHAPSNLRTLCRRCNSARPVQGAALIADLAIDGLTLNDMQRMCMHVQTRGEGKGREGEEDSEAKASGSFAADPAKAVFDAGVKVLGGCGISERQSRTFIGKLRRDHPGQDGQILTAIMDCGRAGAVDPIPWITVRLTPRFTPQFDPSKFEGIQ